MNDKKNVPFRVAFATDLSEDCMSSFMHSVALARASGGELFSLHANPEEGDSSFHEAGEVLNAWSDDSTVPHHKVKHLCCEDPVDTLLDTMSHLVPDLLVVGTHSRGRLSRLVSGSVSEAIALNAKVPTLFLPVGHDGFVASSTGEVLIEKILVLVGDMSSAEKAVGSIVDLMERMGVLNITFTVLHVGSENVLDNISMPDHSGWIWQRERRSGSFEDTVSAVANEQNVDLIVIATRKKAGVIDYLKTNHTQAVLREGTRPILSVPLAR